jgi:hypothetical protein
MKYKIFFLVLFVLVCLKLAAQKQHFDVYQYVEPKGWVKEAKQGMVLYTSMDEKKGTYCIIGLSVSQSSKGDVEADFDAEWKRIILPLGVSVIPQKQVGEETKGWKLISGTGTFETAGTKSATLLNTFSGHNKAASVFFTFNNGMYQKALEEFSNTLELITPEPMVSDNQPENIASSSNTSSTGFSYTIPKGWNVTKNSNGAESISSPLLECKEYSYYTIRLSGTSTYTGSLQEYAHNLHKASFYQQNDWRQYMEGDKRIVKGIDANGHEFLTYETSAALFNSDRNYHYGMVYLVRSGNQLISIFA